MPNAVYIQTVVLFCDCRLEDSNTPQTWNSRGVLEHSLIDVFNSVGRCEVQIDAFHERGIKVLPFSEC